MAALAQHHRDLARILLQDDFVSPSPGPGDRLGMCLGIKVEP